MYLKEGAILVVVMATNEEIVPKQTQKRGERKEMNITLTRCKKNGHIKSNCYKLKAKKEKAAQNENEEIALVTANVVIPKITKMWIGDIGASNHMTNNCDGMKNLCQFIERVKIGDGSTLLCSARGNLDIIYNKQKITLQNVMYIPKLQYILFSLAQVTKRRNAMVEVDQNSMTVRL